jgi:TM2 domain-containing membrane protein YozV
MKRVKSILFIGIAVMFLLSSCTMEKRVYLSGFHVEWKKSKEHVNHQEQIRNNALIEAEQNQVATVSTLKNNDNAKNNNSTVEDNEALSTNDYNAPIVNNESATNIDNDNIVAAVDNNITISQSLKPTFYKTGTSVNSEKATNVTQITSKQTNQKSKAASTEKSESKGKGKSWIVALLLAFFLGALGIHRFYLGYTTIGIIQLLTAGGLVIWALIDFIRILIKDLKPKDGDYTD